MPDYTCLRAPLGARWVAPLREGPALSDLRPAIFGSRLNLLLLFLPIAVALEMVHAGDVWMFAASSLSIIPLAGLIGHPT